MKKLNQMKVKINPYARVPIKLTLKIKEKTNITLFDIFSKIGKRINFTLYSVYDYLYKSHNYYTSNNFERKFSVSYKTMSQEIGINLSTLSRVIKLLNRLTLIKIIKRGSDKDARCSEYRLIEPTQINLLTSLKIAEKISKDTKTLRTGNINNNSKIECGVDSYEEPIKTGQMIKSNNKEPSPIVKSYQNKIRKALGLKPK